ncbi:ABC transporter ATP-binding protein [Emergencia timonensis]|uniref:ABC transporter ATP-binding protein n=1 Tax=Emergencia timonensis TaxID=1776384 RepID=UPI003994A8D2
MYSEINHEVLVRTEHLKKYFPLRKSKKSESVRAVDDVSLEIYRGETLGLVGESGSGKTTIAKMILGLLPPTENTIYIDGKDVWDKKNNKSQRNSVGAVFQDPASSLNPRRPIYRSLERPLIINGFSKTEAKNLIYDTAEKINIGRELLERFPHELSGGQQQRVSIARAIMLQPKLLVLDEPTSALDVSVQAQTLNELLKLQEEFNMTYLFITHNLSVVRYMSDRICVMYGGKLMEIGSTGDVYNHYVHPYTFGLLSSVPPLHPKERHRKKYLLSGDMPSLVEETKGCRFASRCKFCQNICQKEMPAMKRVGEGHLAACHFAGEIKF